MADTETKVIITAVDKTAEAFKSVNKGLGDLSSNLGRLLGPLAALGTLGGFASFIKSTINAGDELNKLSQKTGATVEALSAYRYAASLANISNEQLGTGLSKLQKSMAEALTDPAGEAARTFRALGVAVDDGKGKLHSTNQVLDDMAVKFATAKDGPEKTAIAMRLLGRSGAELIPFLNSLKESTDEAKRMGLIVSTEFAQKSEQFNDNIKRMESNLNHLGAIVAGPVVKAFNDMYAAMTKTEQLDLALKRYGDVRDTLEELQSLSRKQEESFGRVEPGLLARIAYLEEEKARLMGRIVDARKTARDREKRDAASALNLPGPITSGGRGSGRGSEGDDAARAEGEFSSGQTAAGIQLMAEEIVRTYQTAGEKIAELKQAQLDRDVESVMRSILSEKELIDQKYADELQTLYDARQAEYLTEAQFREAMEALEQEHQIKMGNTGAVAAKKLADFEKMTAREKTQFVLGQMLSLTNGVATSNKAMFEINKIAGIANATINTALGVTEALKSYPPPLSFVMAALQLAAGLAQIQQIKATSFGSATSAPSIAGGGATPTTNADMGAGVPSLADAGGSSQRDVQINIQGDATTFTQDWLRNSFIPGLNDALGDGIKLHF